MWCYMFCFDIYSTPVPSISLCMLLPHPFSPLHNIPLKDVSQFNQSSICGSFQPSAITTVLQLTLDTCHITHNESIWIIPGIVDSKCMYIYIFDRHWKKKACFLMGLNFSFVEKPHVWKSHAWPFQTNQVLFSTSLPSRNKMMSLPSICGPYFIYCHSKVLPCPRRSGWKWSLITPAGGL